MMKRILFLLFALLPLFVFGQVQDINVGTSPDDGTGDNLRNAFIKVNSNFDYIDEIKLDSSDVESRINDTANILRTEWRNDISDSIQSSAFNLDSTWSTVTVLDTLTTPLIGGNVTIEDTLFSGIVSDSDSFKIKTGIYEYYFDNNGNSSLAGSGNDISGEFNTSLGFNNDITGDASTILGGLNNTLTGNYSSIIAVRQSSMTGVQNCVILSGIDNDILGSTNRNSVILNGQDNTITSAQNSLVSGLGNASVVNNESVFGQYSTTWTPALDDTDRLFTIGNGQNSSNRSDAFIIRKNGNTEINGNLNVSDTIYNENNPAVKIHRIANLNVTVANSWQNVKFDTLIQDESTWGFALNADSTGIITSFNGVIDFSGCSHWDWNGAAGTTVKIYTRVVQDGVELRCSQANDTRTAGSGDNASLRYGGSVNVAPGDVLRLQYYVTNVALDFEGDPVFDDGIAFTFQAGAKTLQP